MEPAGRQRPWRKGARLVAPAFLLVLAAALLPTGALALSEVQREELPPPVEEGEVEVPSSPPPAGMPVPLPDPIVIPQDPAPAPTPAVEDEEQEAVPDVHYDVELLPESVRRMRALVMEACLTGDVEALRPLIGLGDNPTQLSFGTYEGDPIEFLRGLSGDEEGQEILAILYEVLAAGYVLLDEGQPGEMYVWPYFFAVPLEQLDKRQRVELFQLVTAGDYEDMKNYGSYIFYRAGISTEGRWLFFVAGD